MNGAWPRQSPSLAFLGLAGIGVAIGLMHLPLSLQLSITMTYQTSTIRTLVMLLYPIAMALTGLGAVLAMKRPGWAGPGILRVAGMALCVLLFASLRLNFLTHNLTVLVGAWVAHLSAIGLWYVSLGAGQTVFLAWIRRSRPELVGPAWGVHLVGLMVGYLLSEASVVHVGANAVLLGGALALMALPRASLLALLPVLFLFRGLDVDVLLEDFRAFDDRMRVNDDSDPNWKSQRSRKVRKSAPEREYLGWSRFGQVQVFEANERIATHYNLKHQHEFRPTERESGKDDAGGSRAKRGRKRRGGQRTHIRQALYALFPPEAQVVMVGVGSGRSLLLLTQGPSITAVERDPAAAHFFAAVRPELNGGVFTDGVLVVADGRFALETLQEPVDGIILESSHYQPSQALLPATPTHYLHTEEAIESYLNNLTPSGVLIAEFTRVGEARSHQYVPVHVVATLQKLGASFTVFRSGTLETVTIVASYSEAATEPFVAALDRMDAEQVTKGWNPAWDRKQNALTDDQPFAGWQTFDARPRTFILASGGGLMLLTMLVAGVMRRRARNHAWNATTWFFVLGYAHTGLQLHAFHAWRTYFGDQLITVLWLIVAFLAYGAVGSALVEPIRALSKRRQLLLTALLLFAHVALMAGLPFSSSAWIRWLYAALALLPGGLLMGFWLPLGLRRADTGGLGVWLAADALGTLAGAGAIYLLMVPLGGTVYLIPAVLAYLWLAYRWTGTEQ